ncbi:MaoC/PaaZ C-terminal domain-containing protein [Nocardioides marmorisolisilvae]|uniref:Dehydratase n=1 Tax=Nocardioides marmorisolisilvae TaxID=1542737 RepID=A0A3N0DZU2_9ACTN|nr:MaoC/PaaZ C-terminal domain-containing protein [Nocardioides marmorisolisilvae]RNL81118.1 dehydratase [Nocardioides marmorisolisilvae]
MSEHEFNTDVIGAWSESMTFDVTQDRLIAYAAATNDDLAPHAAGEYGVPVFAVVPPFPILASSTMAAVPDELMMRVLHGEQDIRIHRPIRPGETLSCRAKVTGVHGRSSGVVVTALVETTSDGEPVNDQYFTAFFRGGQLDGGFGEEPPAHGFDEALRSREPDAVVVQKYDEDQTWRYAEASGDPMPIHTDEEFAKAMGLPGIIIHGLCTMAFTSRAVIETACPEDPSRLKRIAVRFSSTAFPRNTISTSIWNTGEGTYAFETTSDEGASIIKDGLAEIAEKGI